MSYLAVHTRPVATGLLLCLVFVLCASEYRGRHVTSPSGVAMPRGDLHGWRQVLAEDFAGPQLPTGWFRYEGTPAGDPAGYFEPGHVRFGRGVLTVVGRFDATRRVWATGGTSTRHALKQTYGKYQVRFRMGAGRGISYAILLWPADNSWPPEIDFAEDNADDRGRLYATLHHAGGGRIEHSIAGDFRRWHTAGVEWTPGRLIYEMDGRVWATVRSGSVPEVPMSLAVQSQAWPCAPRWQRCPDSTTPATVDLEVDWVVAYAQR